MSRISKRTIGLLIIAIAATTGANSAVAEDNVSAAPVATNPPQMYAPAASAGENIQICCPTQQQQCLEDLTIWNFFSAGWDDPWAKRERETGTPDFALLRVQTNFMEREFRANAFGEENVNSPKTKNLTDVDDLIAWSFNRRFMIEVTDAYEWIDPRTGDRDGGGLPGMAARFQLVDTESSSYSLNFKAQAANQELGITQTTLSYGIAGFEDLAYYFNLNRVGLYYSFLFDSYSGTAAVGTKTSDVQYDVTVAKTITSPDIPLIGSLTGFVENFAQTDLDGSHNGRTIVSITPGVRFNLGQFDCLKMGSGNWILLGVDLPVSDYRPWDEIYRLTYIKNF